MADKKSLGEFEITVLAALMRLGAEAYGVSIRQEIETRGRRKVSVGALYATLARLEDKGLVAGRLGEATAERGGRAKRYYDITGAGAAQFEHAVARLGAMVEGLAPWPVA